MTQDFDILIAGERARLVRLCATITGNAAVAEDLAQETMLEAWRHIDRLQTPEGLAKWLAAIARNVCLRWGRRHGRELSRQAAGVAPEVVEQHADEQDFEVELEREELADLLDRAMELLPAETRQALVQRYLDDASEASIGAQLGLSEGAVAKRLERGKLTLRRVLTNELAAEASAFGSRIDDPANWQELPLWCTDCGERRLRASYDPAAGYLLVRCVACHPPTTDPHSKSRLPEVFNGTRRPISAYWRLVDWAYDYYPGGLVKGTAQCTRCGAAAPVKIREVANGKPGYNLRIQVVCQRCVAHDNWQTLAGLTLDLPEARAFWREHPRLVTLPTQELTVNNRAALLTTLQSKTASARLDVIRDRATLQLLGAYKVNA